MFEGAVVYVSLPPGAILRGDDAAIRNRRTGVTVTTAVVDGGFDPVAMAALADDTLDVTVTTLAGDTFASFVIVPRKRRPVVVRTDPPPKKRDVPLNASVVIVFSEPIDPTTIDDSSIRLTHNGNAIVGTAQVLASSPWIVQFVPHAPLAPGAIHELAVTSAVRDLEGAELENGVTVTFTTALTLAGRLAFSAPDGAFLPKVIYTMNPDGSGLNRLAVGMDPSWSPDGSQIAFWRWDTPGGEIYVMNANGSNVRFVTAPGYQPTWSPDGQRLAFGCGGLCVVDVDGAGRSALTQDLLPTHPNPADLCIAASDPAWSPDGSTIAFTRWPQPAEFGSPLPCTTLRMALNFPFDFWTQVWFIEADGSSARALRDESGFPVTYAGWPAWSPDGSHLAFYNATESDERILVVRSDGSGLYTVARRSAPLWDPLLAPTRNNLAFGAPDWSPDGTRIVYGSTAEWYFADAGGSGDQVMVTTSLSLWRPNWFDFSWSRP